MSEMLCLKVLTLVTIFAVNFVKTDNTIDALRKILIELNAPTQDRYDEPSHQHEKSRQDTGSLNSPNLMNLFLKPNKRMRDEADLKRLLYKDTDDNVCKATGRCGCTGSRCGSNRDDDLAEEVDKVVKEINKKLPKDEDELRNEEKIVDDDQDDKDREDYDNDDDDENRKTRDENRGDDGNVDSMKIGNRDDYGDIQHDRHGDKGDIERDVVERKDHFHENDLFERKTIKINDNIDVVILDKSDLETLLRNQDFVDLTRNDADEDDEDQEIFAKVLQDLKKFIAKEEKTERTNDVITPDEFFNLYEAVKHQRITTVLNYIKNKKLNSFLNIKHVSLNQKRKLRSLKMKYRRGDIQKVALEEEIEKILYGMESNARVLAHQEHNNHIYVPKWIYATMLDSKTIKNNYLRYRNQKRILPLTFQQRERLFNKEKVTPIPKVLWRKNSNHNIERFGIPFDFEVHGLGQMVP